MNLSSDTNNNNDTNIQLNILNTEFSRRIIFIFLIILFVPSIFCSFCILYFTIRKQQIRKHLKNHVILCIFFVNFLLATCELPLTLSSLQRGDVPLRSEIFCKYWFSAINAFFMCSLQLNAFLSIERYLLIFHSRTLHRYKIILHYIPMIFLVSYPIPYSFSFTMFYPCKNKLDYNMAGCGSVCYIFESAIGITDWVVCILGPLLIIIIANVLLIVQVYQHKRQMLRKHIWKKKHRMLRELVFVSGLECISWSPVSLISGIDIISTTKTSFEPEFKWVLFGFIYLAILFSPLVSIIALPELKIEITKWTQKQCACNNNGIHPMMINPSSLERT
ncbi:unnamed protein product [Rotaria magnacalcarata]|uniref:G-protein coupled receptors family 1 profile domain-containing protein n=1 Tax=Rotaria magnacalcarata TaxID=392030 RepID=A0A816ZIF6_9BILA|nr:unnamed protein product [Rotaria magnacalcarata]CAF3847152.1 unnamed protein product [Rotaria magnacalcarata]